MAERFPVSVVIRTIGRPELLTGCLDSVAHCTPRAAEIVVVDQSRLPAIRELVDRFSSAGARTVQCDERGRGRALNVGLGAAQNATVLVTDDDCTVAPSWVGVGWRHLARDPDAIVTGRVLPGGDPSSIPSTNDDPVPHDYTGKLEYGCLYAGNMALNAKVALAFGGFDERVVPAAEDNDFCYRWLRAGRKLLYDPELVVWHHDWRTERELEELYVRDARGQGVFYAKHLRSGDMTIARFLARDLYRGLRGMAARVLHGRRAALDGRQALLRGLPVGLVEGWRAFRPGRDGKPGA